MKAMRILQLAASGALLFPCCSSPPTMIREAGEDVTVVVRGAKEYDVELVSVQLGDSALLCVGSDLVVDAGPSKQKGSVALISASAITQIEVSGFRNQQWPLGVLAFQVLPAIGLGVAAGSVDNENAVPMALVGMTPALLSVLFFATSGVPVPTLEGALSQESLLELRKYARFAGELTSEQVDTLLKSYNQKEIIHVK